MAKDTGTNGNKEDSKAPITNPTLDFLVSTKEQLKENNYRQTFDTLLDEIEKNLVNTAVQKRTIDQSVNRTVLLTVPRGDGQNDFLVLPRVSGNTERGTESNTPRAEVPIAFSKILVAASALFSNMPDGTAYSVNKIKARVMYELWKRSWAVIDMNGMNTIDYAVQQMLTTGTGAWRVYPRQVIVDKTVDLDGKKIKTKKILYDDIYREPMNMKRTWLGLSYKAYSDDGRPEVLWEIDVTKEEFKKLKKRFKKKGPRTGSAAANPNDDSVTEEALEEDPNKNETHVTLTFYENPKENRYIMASQSIVFYDGEMPNEEVYGQIVVVHCMHKNMYSPYGVGLYELMRGNQTIQNYIQSLTIEQVAAEIIPIIFASGNIQGDMTFQRSTSKLNVLPAGTKVDKMTMTGNSTLGMNTIERLKKENDEITGINDIVSGVSGANTLGESVLLKEAALSRLIKPRNSLARGLEKDFCIHTSWMEQDQSIPREFIFGNQEELMAFDKANPMFHNEVASENVLEKDEFGNPIKKEFTVTSSMRVPFSFDYNPQDLTESDYQDQNIQELDNSKNLMSRAGALKGAMDLDQPEKIGYDRVYLVIDPNSMLIPSVELQKQVSAQNYPIIQNSIMQIFGTAMQNPPLARALLKTFTTFCEQQKLDVYSFIPKDLYDQIMAAQMGPTPEEQAMMAMQGGEEEDPMLAGDNTPVGQAQAPEEMARNNIPFPQSFMGGGTNISKKVSKSTKK